jgi:hypothetical protein
MYWRPCPLFLLLLSHISTHGLPLGKRIINAIVDLLEFTVERTVTFRERWQAAKGRWKAAG